VPVRIHTFTGQVWVTRHGVQRMLLKWFDRLIGSFATCALADSPSQRDFLVKGGVLPPGKARVIGAGSICGVDASRFHPDPDVRRTTRDELGIAQDARMVLFVGRLNRDKGLLDLAAAFAALAQRDPKAMMLLVGAEEDVPFGRIQEICRAERGRLRYVSFSATPERYMKAADVLCLPSYREGFGQVIIEAAACGVPAVATRIYGVTDAVADGKTGLLFLPGDVTALTQALLKLVTENGMRQQMGDAARARALELFSGEKITRETLILYERLSAGYRGKNAKELD
jgi:glycosyltransferase involved in cell wall biosynthesis